MPITINEPACLNEIGGRDNNEDSIFPQKNLASAQDKLFIVCDGVGGSNYGEVASKLACEALADFVMFEDDFIPEKAISFVEMRFSDYFDVMPQYHGMSTTLVFLLFNNEKPLIGWIGDSRAYHIRNGEILFQTEDHSLVVELINKGEITVEEAKYDYRRNIITRVISGIENPSKIDTKIIDDIQTKDYFLLCSDGLLEHLDETIIKKYFNGSNKPNEISDKLFRLCEGKTNDNYSMYVIQLE